MSASFKTCPICGASNARSALKCSNCGTSLANIEATSQGRARQTSSPQYDYRYGETDLYEGNLKRGGGTYLAGGLVVLALLLCGGFSFALGSGFFSNMDELPMFAEAATPTPRPTLDIPTVTQGAPTNTPTATGTATPTATMTPTPEPCYQEVQSGDTLYSVVARCGYSEFESIFPIVQATNDISDPAFIQLGARLEIPWPTPTPDPSTLPTPDAEQTGEASAGGDEIVNASASGETSAFEEEFDPLFVPTATLPPGIQYHVVQQGETIASIVSLYGIDVELISQLNRTIDFPQCDFGETFGGPRCQPMLSIGQQIRVPAPLPTETPTPTPSGSETPTPSPTATFNAPSALSPDDRALFRRTQLITLRWMGSGTLDEGQVYRLRVEDTTAGVVYTVDTINTSFIIPEDWQGQDSARHVYEWTVSVIELDRSDSPLFVTNLRTFTWEGLLPAGTPTASGR
ncbi:MAG: LysM peptidoglycan-binding domain-containing protein [bacterium]|nr:LysM peptidoglycan-binding domain-containing protein [bacterium]